MPHNAPNLLTGAQPYHPGCRPILPGIAHVVHQIPARDLQRTTASTHAVGTGSREVNEHHTQSLLRETFNDMNTSVPGSYVEQTHNQQLPREYADPSSLEVGLNFTPSQSSSPSGNVHLSPTKYNMTHLPPVHRIQPWSNDAILPSMELSTELTSQHKHKLHNREYRDDLNELLERAEAYLMDFWGWRGKKEQSEVRKGGRESNAAKTGLTYQKGSALEATIQAMQYAELLSQNFVPESMMAQLWSQLVDLDWEGFVNDKEQGQMCGAPQHSLV